jgi:hypothetical protein
MQAQRGIRSVVPLILSLGASWGVGGKRYASAALPPVSGIGIHYTGGGAGGDVFRWGTVLQAG